MLLLHIMQKGRAYLGIMIVYVPIQRHGLRGYV